MFSHVAYQINACTSIVALEKFVNILTITIKDFFVVENGASIGRFSQLLQITGTLVQR
jgi:hypothetical protein